MALVAAGEQAEDVLLGAQPELLLAALSWAPEQPAFCRVAADGFGRSAKGSLQGPRGGRA